MGDRRHLVFDYGDDRKIFLYSHWHGRALPQMTTHAIRDAKGRWNDGPYFTRIVIDQVTAIDRDRETGWGISPWYMESEYDDVIIDVNAQTVSIGTLSWSYQSFIEQDFTDS